MSRGKRINQKGRSKGRTKFVMLHDYELLCPAYRYLPCIARALYVQFKLLYNGSNNGEIYLSVRKAAELLGISPNTASKAIGLLSDRKFIIPNRKGSFSWKVGNATTWILTELPFNGSSPTREYRQWRSSKDQNAVSKPDAAVSKTAISI